jgi:hypothetical protein
MMLLGIQPLKLWSLEVDFAIDILIIHCNMSKLSLFLCSAQWHPH